MSTGGRPPHLPHSNIFLDPKERGTHMSEVILQTQELTRRYGHTVALDRASITVEKGQIFGLVGRNGAGKTTLIRLISGQSVPTSGQLSPASHFPIICRDTPIFSASFSCVIPP